ncbi:MAG TPA: DEAD/DEAH box helicase [Acidimicrobiales bacterium]|nr:DEAD/DEAH box helicase [Acidimicrobiales bacterium]
MGRDAGGVKADSNGQLRKRFLTGYPFELDPFQLGAMDALDEGHSVVVAAPTGAGKTVVAEYAVARALAEGAKAFYTTPLKALSNQKFADFTRLYGRANVGLLTGDNAINGEAPVVVMTTEVLRNMIYAGSASLKGLRYVVLDEVHYLQDPYRGPVWEEVIIHLPPEVDLVCLSATVSNAEELADWVETVRGSTRALIEERRPVPLHNLFLVGDQRSDELVLLPTFVDGHPNPRGIAVTSRVDGGWRAHRRNALFPPRRVETVELLARESLLPAIYFIFSRAGCDEAVRQCMRVGRRMTSASERRQIREIAEATAGRLSDDDLAALGYGEWLASLQAGFAAHHAGLVPPFKEAVERCFSAGLVKIVFATETLSLGINMPARSVVIERLSKFSGERVEPLTPGEYTQLTGRAGRRGTDDVGYAVVMWSPGTTFDQVASLAGARSYTLTSSFRPTYNMASNLVRRCTPSQAHHLLNLSFAQYTADADIVRLESYLERSKQELAAARADAKCELGDVFEYRRLTTRVRRPEPARRAKPADIVAAMEGLRPGDVLMVPARKPGGARTDDKVAILSTRHRKKGDLTVRAITAGRRLVSLGPRDFHVPPRIVAHVDLPAPYAPKDREFQRRVASSLASAYAGGRPDAAPHRGDGRNFGGDHPVAACRDVAAHLRAAGRAERLERQVERLERQVLQRTESLARQFDRVLQLLERWGYVKGWALTGAGSRLARIYHEQDLLVAECAERGILDGLAAAELAGLVSVFTYEPRGPLSGEAGVARFPGRPLGERWQAVQQVARELASDEAALGLPLTRAPDAGFVALAQGWASGKELGPLLSPPDTPNAPAGVGNSISAGDFVRNVKQLIDLLRQLGEVLADEVSRRSARQAADALFRGVVAASSVVNDGG